MNNEVIYDAWVLPVTVTDPATPQGGDPCRWGFLTGVAVDDENAAGVTVVDFGQRVHNLKVTDRATGGIAVGDTLFYANSTHDIDNVTTGTPFGYAMETVGSGLSATIKVLHVPGHGAATLGSGVVSAANLASNAVTTAKIANANVTGAKLATGIVKIALAAGTAAATNVTLAGIAIGDELVSVLSFATAAAIATVADRTSEYAVGSGVLTKSAGTNETGNQLVIVYLDKT